MHQKAARGRSMKVRPTQSRKGVKGQLPLAGSRDSVPCGVWGNAPTVPRATSMPNALNKGAGSEASLPVTLRSRRSAPELLFPPRFREEPIKMRWNAIFSASSAFCFLYFFPSSSSFCSSCMNVPISVNRRYTAAKRTYATSFVAFSSSITMSPMRWEEISPSMLA